MATKTKAPKESALKEPVETSPVTAPEKKGAKLKKEASVQPEPLPVEVPKSEKTVSKPKPKSKLVAVSTEPVLEIVSKSSETPVKKTLPKVEAVAEPAIPLPLAVAGQDKKWQEIRLILEKLKEDTLREIRKSVKNGTEAVAAIEPGGDIYDQASSERDRELGLLLGDREREKIHSIDESLLRIDEGDYGICEECDEDIPLGRLKAMPFTRHCVKCKSDLEKLQAQTKRVEEERAYREIPLGSEEDES
jgi:DnaK suppressor protein